ncbi:hypothetical protein LQQ78_25655 (plasmid) [Escherichia coli]|nr:hypothetical protein [Escherichia coli]
MEARTEFQILSSIPAIPQPAQYCLCVNYQQSGAAETISQAIFSWSILRWNWVPGEDVLVRDTAGNITIQRLARFG